MKKYIDKILMATAGVTIGAGVATGAVFAFYHPKSEGPTERSRDKTIDVLNENNITFYNQSLVGIYKKGFATNILVQAVSKGAPTLTTPTHILVNKVNESFTLPFVDGTYHIEVRNAANHDLLNWEININPSNEIKFSKTVTTHITGKVNDGSIYTSTDSVVYNDYNMLLTSYSGVGDSALLNNINIKARKAGLSAFSAKETTTSEQAIFKGIGDWGINNSSTSSLIKSQLKTLADKKANTVVEKAYCFTNGTDTFTLIQSNTGTDATAGRHYSEAISGTPFKVLGVKIDPVTWAFQHNQRATKQLGIRFKYSAAFDKVSSTTLAGDNITINSILKTLLGTQ